ncbi:NAD-binding protein [Fomitopsis schrenkii]|uniref:NAD-binding protein n=1 Tax=Fomitopsis schrenkii TaxID=2126942 RepID=S8DXV1_FOMSC|nr:NAD-binding protein [Fomitopsis schrenkii]
MVAQAAVQALAAVGIVLLIAPLYRLLSFIWFYFLRPSKAPEYLHAAPAYALITGATDGIGKALAKELYEQGFNLILHGRNEEKMRKVVEEVRGVGARDVLYFLADASRVDHDFEQMMAQYKNLHITVVVHNVGSQDFTKERIDGFSQADLMKIVNRNSIFPLYLTHTLLPQLRQSARTGPVLVQFMGSLASEICPPRFAMYAASKSFLKALTRGLDNDERVWGAPTGVRFEYLLTGQVQSNSMRLKPTLDTPTSETYAKAIVARMGCGYRVYCPYWVHAALKYSSVLAGEGVQDTYSAQRIADLIVVHEKQN